MAGGRPSQGKQQRYPELEELASWFHRALTDAGYRSVNEFLARGLFGKNAVYGVLNAARLLPLEDTQSLAVALKRTPAQVEPIWIRAKEARDRAAHAAQRAQQPRVTSWAEIPMPSLALRNLLEAQCASVERLPYELLGVQEPPLSSVYVRVQVQVWRATDRSERESTAAGRLTADEPSASVGPRRKMSVPDVLEQYNHLLVTGEPGVGKSTMSSYLARSLSRLWLREDSAVDAPITEPLVPLRVSARSLDGTGSWSAVLAEAASRSFGRSLLVDPDPSLFAGRAQGARWLVLVDGLDEIPDPRLRGEIVRSVAQHSRPDSDYRFVVTTRALPESELAPLLTATVGNCVIEQFDRPELEQFASKWFIQQERSPAEQLRSAAAKTERFLRETSDGRLRELVRNPLLATIAAVSAVREPDRPLPASRISLYKRFCSYLAGDRGGKRNLLAQLRRHHEDNPELLACVRWLHRSRSEILGALARCRLEGQDELWQAAVEWSRDQVPEDIVLVDGWEDCLWEDLVGSGLLVARERELRFLHQSFAEFLSAQSHAESIGDDFDELDVWIRRGLREAERTFALFTFAMWADRPGHDIGAVVDHLLSSLDPRRLLLAGRLMAEGVSVPDHMATRVIDRLFALARNVADSNLTDEGFEVLGALFDYPTLPARLDVLAGDTKVWLWRRVSALEAFEQLRGGERAQLLLAELLPSVYGKRLHQCARIAVRLGPAAVDMVKRRALQMVDEPDSDTEERADAAEAVRILDLVTNVADLARSVLGDTRSTPQQLRRVADAWLAAQGETAVPEIAALASGRPEHDHEGRVRLAAFLHKVGDGETAESLAGAVLDNEMADGNAVVIAAETLLSVRGAAAVPRVLLAVDRWSEGSNRDAVWHAARMLKHLATYPEAAVVSRVSALLEGLTPSGHDLIDAWLAVEPAGESILDAIDRGAAFDYYDQAWAAQHFQDAGQQAAATELAERALRSRHGRRQDYEKAASVLLKADRAVAVSQLILLGEQNPGSAWLAGVMDALEDPDVEVERARAFCARELVAHPLSDGEKLRDALGTLLVLEGESAAQSVAEAARTRHELGIGQRREVVRALAAVGQLDLARSVWTDMLGWQGYPASAEVDLVQDYLNAGVEVWAAERMQELIDDPATAPLRVQRLRQMLAWLTAGCGSAGTSG